MFFLPLVNQVNESPESLSTSENITLSKGTVTLPVFVIHSYIHKMSKVNRSSTSNICPSCTDLSRRVARSARAISNLRTSLHSQSTAIRNLNIAVNQINSESRKLRENVNTAARESRKLRENLNTAAGESRKLREILNTAAENVKKITSNSKLTPPSFYI